MAEHELLIVGAANRPYEHYALPYVASALITNPDSVAEILVEPGFVARHPDGVQHVMSVFPDRVAISYGDFRGHPSCARFLHNPKLSARYAYIGDIDVLMLLPILEMHVPLASEAGVPYSNSIRKDKWEIGQKRLMGCHFTEFDAYYPVKPPEGFDLDDAERGVDERLLYEIVKEQLGSDPISCRSRPIQGFHLSPNGKPLQAWGVENPRWRAAYNALASVPVWQECVAIFDAKYKATLALLDASIQIFEAFTPEERTAHRAFVSLMDKRG